MTHHNHHEYNSSIILTNQNQNLVDSDLTIHYQKGSHLYYKIYMKIIFCQI